MKHTTPPQALTQESTKVHRGSILSIQIDGIRSVHAYTAHSKKKNLFMPKVSAPNKHKHVNSSSLGSLGPSAQNNVDVVVFQTTQRGPPCQSIVFAVCGRPVTDTSLLRSLAEGDLFHS